MLDKKRLFIYNMLEVAFVKLQTAKMKGADERMQTNRRSIHATDTGDRLFSIFVTTAAPMQRTFTAHHHTSFEIAYFRRGRGTYMVADRAYEIEAGDIFLFSTDEVHFISEINEEIDALVLHIEPCFIWSPGDSIFDYSFLKVFFDRDEHVGNRITSGTPLADKLALLLSDINTECEEAKKNYELMVKIKLLTVLVTLLRELPEHTQDTPSPRVSPGGFSLVQSVLSYIHEHYTEDITLDDLAAHSGVSRNYLSGAFRRLNGMTVWNYILIKRVDLAKNYLSKTDRSMLEIAADCGFNSTANFNKAFKKYTSQTPSQYRHTHRFSPSST